MTTKIILAGFGGQGILYASKTIAKLAMHDGKYVSWLPSYGPEMRGGTCNCGVIVSDEPIGSPIVTVPDIIIVFNIQSMDKFEPTLISGGTLIADSTLIERKAIREDINAYYIPATGLAAENKVTANTVMLGYVIKKTGLFDYKEFVEQVIAATPESKPELREANRRALDIGYNYEG